MTKICAISILLGSVLILFHTILSFHHFDEDEDFFGAVLELILIYSCRFNEMNSSVFVPLEINKESKTPVSEIDPDFQFEAESDCIHDTKSDYYLEDSCFHESKTDDLNASFSFEYQRCVKAL